MPNLTADQAKQLSKNLFGLAHAIGSYRHTHINELPDGVFDTLLSDQRFILTTGEKLLALSATLLMNDASNALGALTHVTEDINQSIENIQNVQKVINVAAAVVQLGGAIISKSPDAIAQSLQKLIDTWQQSVGDN